MLSTYHYPRYESPRPDELDAPGVRRVPLVVIGAGPVGLCAAIDAAQQGLPVVLLDEDETVSTGSRGLCYAKRTLEILDRLGVGDEVVAKGVTWNVGRTFHREREVFRFNLLPEAGHRRPGMVNLQQYWLEQILVERAQRLPGLDLRWRSRVAGLVPQDDGAALQVQTPHGNYTLHADWVVVADGARSPMRRLLGLDIEGRVFQDRFLIADVVLDDELFPSDRTERWFWFDPPFHEGQSVLLHREADNVWRIDFQLGWGADPEAEKQPERVIPRIRAMLDSQGFQHVGFELEWVSVYTFQCRRMKAFRQGRVLFTGDAAHQVSPFGARGANSGIQDADNLMWKLRLVMQGHAEPALLDSYDRERAEAADENILNSTRSTDFITPKSRASQLMRNAVLTLAGEVPGARALVNSGRLSVPTVHAASPLSTPDAEPFEGWMVPGAPMDDAPVRGGWLLEHFGNAFSLMVFAASAGQAQEVLQNMDDARAAGAPELRVVLVVPPDPAGGAAAAAAAIPRLGLSVVEDSQGLAARRFDAGPGTCYLIRPDQIVAARWRTLQPAAVRAALARATGVAHAEA
ncbi:MAG: FAD-dependent oxidoreductase [Rubrivivax sp.]